MCIYKYMCVFVCALTAAETFQPKKKKGGIALNSLIQLGNPSKFKPGPQLSMPTSVCLACNFNQPN